VGRVSTSLGAGQYLGAVAVDLVLSTRRRDENRESGVLQSTAAVDPDTGDEGTAQADD
jgi:hypothetical protein